MTKNKKEENGKKKIKAENIDFLIKKELLQDNPEVPVGKIMVVVDIPEKVKEQFRINEEDLNKIVTDSVYMIVDMIDELIDSRKGKDIKKDDVGDIYS